MTTLTLEQQYAVDKLIEFVADPMSKYFILSGHAGTGKTYCMQEVVKRLEGSKAQFAFTAPTNKATKVLRGLTREACTIYSLLGLRIDKSGELKKIADPAKVVDLSEFAAVVIDESSMINAELFKKLQGHANNGLKIIFVGDPAQLPPVNEAESPIWKIPSAVRASLTKIIRSDDILLDFLGQIRECQNQFLPQLNIQSSNNGDKGMWKLDKAEFSRHILARASKNEFDNPLGSKVIAWKNATVNKYNAQIRSAVWGADAKPGYYLPTERIVAAAPCMRGDEQLMSTDEEGIVEQCQEVQHPVDARYKALQLKVLTEAGNEVTLLAMHPESEPLFKEVSARLSLEAKANPRLWRNFWQHHELFHEVKYAYAITAHRSQGSTYQNVWVDYQDILSNRNRKEAFQCLYVACSRAKERLVLG